MLDVLKWAVESPNHFAALMVLIWPLGWGLRPSVTVKIERKDGDD